MEQKLPPYKRYYQKKRLDPAFMEANRQRSRNYYKRKKSDPKFMENQRAYGRNRYHKKIKPYKTDDFCNQLRENTQNYRARKLEVKIRLQQELGGACVDCGITDPRLLDFDHIDPMKKTMLISQKLHLPYEVLLEEIKNCQLLCPNCHRIKTMEQKELNSYVRKNRAYRNKNRTRFSLPT